MGQALTGRGLRVLIWALWPLLLLIDSQVLHRRRRSRPKRIILVRHGESLGNVDKVLYESTPDSQIQLTETGIRQGREAGEQIRRLVGQEDVRVFFSPYIRTRQTLLAILEAFSGRRIELTTEPRLREQDFGNFQNSHYMETVYKERQKFGRFYYRFPNGEAGTDVYDRVCEFWSTLFRFMDQPSRNEAQKPAENYVLVTHGLLMRIFCMCYFRWTVTEFEQVWNPSNCEIWVLRKTKGGKYKLEGRWNDGFLPIRFGADQSQPLFEHMKTPQLSRQVVPGTPDAFDDPSLAHLRYAVNPLAVDDGVGSMG